MSIFIAIWEAACSEDFSEEMPRSFDYYRYENGQIVEKAVVREGDPGYNALRRLLNSHRAGWNIDLNTYAPELSFQSKGMIIDCRDDMVIVNFRKNGNGSMVELTNRFSGCRTKVLDAINHGEQRRSR